jgi:hypothetical protein
LITLLSGSSSEMIISNANKNPTEPQKPDVVTAWLGNLATPTVCTVTVGHVAAPLHAVCVAMNDCTWFINEYAPIALNLVSSLPAKMDPGTDDDTTEMSSALSAVLGAPILRGLKL